MIEIQDKKGPEGNCREEEGGQRDILVLLTTDK
jgi:hypothetical protein